MASLMISLFDYARMVVQVIEKPLKSARENRNSCMAKYCLTCSLGCLNCFEACLKFINRHAYVQIAMTGKGFCQSTRAAFYLILRNSLRFGTIHGLGALFVFVGQFFITFVSTFIGYVIIANAELF